MKKELYTNPKPLLNGYSFYGGLFSILPDNKNLLPWIFSNFIQLKYLTYDHIIFFDRYRSLLEECPFFCHYVIKYSMITKEGPDSFINWIQKKINENCYCFLYIDRYFLPFYQMYYQKHHCNHELLVYGYDLEKKEFLCADNNDDGKYTHFTCSFYHLNLGYWSKETDDDYYENIHYIENISLPQVPYMLNYKHIKTSFENYTLSLPMINESESCITSEYGFSVHDKLLKHQIIQSENNPDFYLDYRCTYIFLEHKELMKLRLIYLTEQGYLKSNSLYENYAYLSENYRVLLSISMKYNITKNEKLLHLYFDLYGKLISYEKDTLDNLMTIC